MTMIGKLRSSVSNYWQPALAMLAAFFLVYFIFFWRLTSLVSGTSIDEFRNISASHGFRAILNDPSFLIYKLPLKFLDVLNLHGVFEYRAISGAFAVLTLGLIYYTLKKWYSDRVAMIGTAMLLTSSWFIGYGRSATPAIIYPMLLASIFAYGTWMRKTNRQGLSRLLGVLLAACLIYTPGLIWLVFFGVIWQRKAIKRQLPKLSVSSIAGSLILVLALVPLAYSLFNNSDLIPTLIGLPGDLLAHPVDFLGQLVSIPDQLAASGEINAAVGLAGVAILDIFTCTMAVLGFYSLLTKLRLDRSKMLLVTLGYCAILIALGGVVSMAALIPLVYLLVASGIAYMLHEWFIVFPRNPLARGIGLGLIILAVSLTSLYHINRYYVAWPKAPETRVTFSVRSSTDLLQ